MSDVRAVPAPHPGFGDAEQRCAETLITLALAEDLGQAGDLTSSAMIPGPGRGSARFVARVPGTLAGLPVLERLVARVELREGFHAILADGQTVERGDVIAELAGPMRSLLSVERIALNFLQRLSGIASATARYVSAVAGTRATILDTRKTTPGWRALEKYAVRCGGGTNHRFGLFDAVLIKDNHLAWLESQFRLRSKDPIGTAIALARASVKLHTTIEIEIDTFE